MRTLDVTNRFVLDFCRRFVQERPNARVLDFGCGAGGLVAEARDSGIEMYGAEIYYGGSQTRVEAEASGLLGTVIIEMTSGRIGFPDRYFDLVVNNQVMEHVEDLEAVLREIHRVVKPGGRVLSLFPSRDVFREGHIGIPFSHWFRRGSSLRFYYTWTLRRLGFGTWKEQAPNSRQWAADKLEWIDRYTRYRSRREIFKVFGHYFRNEMAESDYIRFRLLDRPGRKWLAAIAGQPLAAAVSRAVFRKLAFLVILSRKEEA